jgi:hypothetical protein
MTNHDEVAMLCSRFPPPPIDEEKAFIVRGPTAVRDFPESARSLQCAHAGSSLKLRAYTPGNDMVSERLRRKRIEQQVEPSWPM